MTRQEKKRLYLELLSMVDALIKPDFADKTKEAYPDLKLTTIQNVRYGRTPRLDVLLTIIRVNLPGFVIPEEFLEAERELQAAA